MHQKPLLSIILTIRNQRSIIEPTLTSLFALESVPFEVFIIDDASSDGSSDAIQSLLDYYQHEQTFFFTHDQPAGRGNCLNEALQQLSQSVVWAPGSIGSIEENTLRDSIHQLQEADQYCFAQNVSLPVTVPEWIKFMEKDEWPSDGDLLWNMDNILSFERFFNPFPETHHAIELAARASGGRNPRRVQSFYTPSEMEHRAPDITDEKSELVFSLLRRADLTAEQRNTLYNLSDRLAQFKQDELKEAELEHELLIKAYQLKKDARFSSALERVEQVLGEDPHNLKAKLLKIELLEKKHRFVEASELKHELHAEEKAQKSKPAPSPEKHEQADIKTSLIIPTALYGKTALEHSLISISEHCDPESTELIVIDNASLDDTHDYLNDLQTKDFFHCKVITNQQNKGFAASVNQGLDAARGTYACIMHSDVQLTGNAICDLEGVMDRYPGYAVTGPLADKTLNPDQSVKFHGDKHHDELFKAEYLDSFCMMVRMDANIRMDEAYELAFFEDIDFCFEARKQGYKVGIAKNVTVEHHYGTTTFALNLDTESEQYWKNVAYFNEKWGVEVYSEEELKSKSTFDQLLALDDLVNPLYPEEAITVWFEQLFTDELKTEMLKTEHDAETLCRLVHLMMVMEQREVMRRLEDRLDPIELPASLIYQLVRFYFNRNIYSRCTHYLDKLKAEQQSLQSELYRLEMMVNNKELETAIPKLKELLEKAPSNPTLYKLAGDIHQFEGNQEDAESFYNIACQINPFEFQKEKLVE